MSFPAGLIVDNILEAMKLSTRDDIEQRVWKNLRMKYWQACKAHSWFALREHMEIDFTSSTATGQRLPSNLFDIDGIREQSNLTRFYEKNRDDIEPAENGQRAIRYHASSAAVAVGEDLTIEKGATVFAAASLATDFTGDYIKLHDQLGYYLLSAQRTISMQYWGPLLDQKRYQVRPPETQNLILFDDTEELWTDDTIDLYYWRAPEMVYEPHQYIVLPSAAFLELEVIRAFPEAKSRRPVSQGEIEEARQEALGLNPSFSMNKSPRDRQMARFSFSQSSPYQQRGVS